MSIANSRDNKTATVKAMNLRRIFLIISTLKGIAKATYNDYLYI